MTTHVLLSGTATTGVATATAGIVSSRREGTRSGELDEEIRKAPRSGQAGNRR